MEMEDKPKLSRFKRVVAVVSLLGIATLVGCSVDSNPKTKAPEGFEVVSKDEIEVDFANYGVTEIKHKETGCYYLVSENGGIVLMQTSDGSPYCNKE